MRFRTHTDRAITPVTSFTEEYGFHGLAKEPLTLFPDGERCPLFAAFFSTIELALFVRISGDER